MKLPIWLNNMSLHTRILGGAIAVIIISIIIMIVRQSQGTIVNQHRETTTINFIGTTGAKKPYVKVEIANTPYKHEYGLMFRGQIEWGNGMLFVFDDEAVKTFWMKNTYIPLDMIFINASGTIVHIAHGAKPMDETPVSSIYPTKYVIEVNSGWAYEAKIRTGHSISLDGLQK